MTGPGHARPAGAPADRPLGYARAATIGTRWATAQGFINKIAAALGMLIVARALDPVDYGIAAVVIMASGLVMVLPVLVMGDVLISHQHHLASVSRAAISVTLWATGISVVLALVTAPFIAWHYDQYPFAPVATLLALSALRPMGDALAVHSLTRLRMALRYREIALISGACHLGQTVVTILWALFWPGAAAIVVPQILVALAKSIWFGIAARRGAHPRRRAADRLHARRPDLAPRIRRRIQREFGTASMAQYVHSMVGGMPVLITSLFVSEQAMGQFGFAMTLAGQAVSIFSYQIGLVLQPIFGILKTDTARQIRGFMRVVRLMSALTVPISMLQAALAEPLVRVFFGEKWLPSVPVLVAFSVGQAAGFLLAPALALLKAQGRFGTNMIWQVGQAAVCLALFPPAARLFGGAGVAWADSAIWFASILVVVIIGVRRAGVRSSAVIAAFVLPWLSAAPIAVGAWLAWRAIPGPTLLADVLAIVLIGPIAFALSILAIRVVQPSVAAEIAPFMNRVLRRVPIAGAPLAGWFGSAAGSAA